MKNSTPSLQRDSAEIQARKAIQRIKQWSKQNYPGLATTARARLIMECLIEITEEKKFLAARS